MEQKQYSDFQETLTFGEAYVFIKHPTLNDCSNNTLSLGVKVSLPTQETLSTSSNEQNERQIANYGPCVVS
ncbi:unnamed protein product [Rotaria sordida]|uniref:Uncharacterized protein n=1 Tax=Rotaria sordida TaxID=392033 RepID=A0A815FUT4_9BILA|nr:unnamed protein product [Rotaria sordida]